MQRTFFDVIPDELGRLGPEPAVAVLREMLWAETHNIGLAITDTDAPFAVTNADGGVDASVRVAPKHAGNGLIFAPKTAYQVKAGDFSLNANSLGQIEALLIAPTAIAKRRNGHKNEISGKFYSRDDMSPRVRQCLDEGGAFVTLLFGNDNTEIQEDASENAIRSFLADIDSRYAGANVRVWRQTKICGLLRQFPAISLLLKDNAGFPLLSFDQWASQREMRREFKAAAEQTKAIEELRASIRAETDQLTHIRVIGEPGIGKTRLVLEMLRADDLKSLTLYADRASKIDGAVVAAIRAAKHANVILVVDECNPEQRGNVMREFDGLHGKLKIVSIYQDEEEGDRSSAFRLFHVPALPAHEIEGIILSYGVDGPVAKAWAELCDGSPRVAHIVAQNLVEHPTDPLQGDGVNMIWVRYLAADVERGSEEYRRRHLVLSSLALFKRFGWSQKVRARAMEVYEKIIVKLEPKISVAEFTQIVDTMAQRKVLQGDHFLYITPRAFHLKLWIDWWRMFGGSLNMLEIVPTLSDQMRLWFGEMIEYGSAAPISKKLVQDLLGPEGPYKDAQWLVSKEGARFFFSLSLASPAGAITVLERTIGKMSRGQLYEFGAGRRDVIWTLEGTALYADLFGPSARLLLKLADAENETWSNNATGVFTGLFALGYGEVAPTSLAPEHRLPVLIDAITKGGAYTKLALSAFDQALSLHSTRWGGDEPFRLRERVERWMPKTNEEWFGAYKLYWQALRSLLGQLKLDDAKRAAKIMLSHMRELFRIEYLHAELIDTLRELMMLEYVDNREVIEDITHILNYDSESLPKGVVEELETARAELVGTSYASRLRRYAGMDLLEDKIDRDGNTIDPIASEIERLAKESLEDRQTFIDELHWLVTQEAKNGFRFGYALGHIDEGQQLWPLIRDNWFKADEKGHDFFIGGYLRAVFEKDVHAWQEIVFKLSDTMPRLEFLPGLVWRSGITDDVAKLLIQLVRDGRIKPENLSIFSMGRASAPIPDATFLDWLDTMLNTGTEGAVTTALHLAAMSMHGGRAIPKEILERLITDKALFEKKSRNDVMLTHYWFELARSLVKADPGAELLVMQTLIANVGNSGGVTATLGSDGEKYLDGLVAKHPQEAWAQLSEYIKPPMDTLGFVLTRWLRGDMGFGGRDPGPMRHIPRELIWDWIKDDADKRASLVASMAPKDFDVESWPKSLIRELLCRFGDRKAVQSAVFSNFFTGGWSGPASEHYAGELATLKNLKDGETDPNALRWLRYAIEATEGSLETAKIEEEARGY